MEVDGLRSREESRLDRGDGEKGKEDETIEVPKETFGRVWTGEGTVKKKDLGS